MASKTPSQKSKISFEDLITIMGIHLPTLKILYPKVELELRGLAEKNETDLSDLLPSTSLAMETLKEIYRLIST